MGESKLASKQARRKQFVKTRLTNDSQAMLAAPRKHSLDNGLKKLRAVAAHWRHRNGCLATTEGGHLLPLRQTRGFAPGTRLTPTEFTEQLRRNFGVYLSPSELAALVKKYDKDGDGQISATEFMKTFKDLESQQKRAERQEKVEQSKMIRLRQTQRDLKQT